MKTVKETLIAAKGLISNPSNWTQNTDARDSEGWEVDPCAVSAMCFCSGGAVRRASGYDDALFTTSLKVLSYVVNDTRRGQVSAYNDTHTHAEVLELFDKAISLA